MVTIHALAGLLARLSSGVARLTTLYPKLQLQIPSLARLLSIRGLTGRSLKVRGVQPFVAPTSTRQPMVLENENPELSSPEPPLSEPLPMVVLPKLVGRKLGKILAAPIWNTRLRQEGFFHFPSSPLIGRTRPYHPTPSIETLPERRAQLPSSSAQPSTRPTLPSTPEAALPRGTHDLAWTSLKVTSVGPDLIHSATYAPFLASVFFLSRPSRVMMSAPLQAHQASQTKFARPELSEPDTISEERLVAAPTMEAESFGSEDARVPELGSSPKNGSSLVGVSIVRLQHGRNSALRHLGLRVKGPAADSAFLTVRSGTPTTLSTVIERQRDLLSIPLVSYSREEGSRTAAVTSISNPPPSTRGEPLGTSGEAKTQPPRGLMDRYVRLGLPLIRSLKSPLSGSRLFSASKARVLLQSGGEVPSASSHTELPSRNLARLVSTYAEAETSQIRDQFSDIHPPARPLPRIELPPLQANLVPHRSMLDSPERMTMSPPSLFQESSRTEEFPNVELPEISAEDQFSFHLRTSSGRQDADDLRQKIAKILAEEARRYLGNE